MPWFTCLPEENAVSIWFEIDSLFGGIRVGLRAMLSSGLPLRVRKVRSCKVEILVWQPRSRARASFALKWCCCSHYADMVLFWFVRWFDWNTLIRRYLLCPYRFSNACVQENSFVPLFFHDVTLCRYNKDFAYSSSVSVSVFILPS